MSRDYFATGPWCSHSQILRHFLRTGTVLFLLSASLLCWSVPRVDAWPVNEITWPNLRNRVLGIVVGKSYSTFVLLRSSSTTSSVMAMSFSGRRGVVALQGWELDGPGT